ncbi:lamin tail domain-containing protein [Candidatus Peregrinibacteria bacterium]|nr:lamin tail domain-containing protein [Candidatus Peregrinibacteria bacterium]
MAKNGDLSNKIFITEIFPNPPGPDTEEEWIELFNAGDTKISLGNWTLDDSEGGSKPYSFPFTTIIKPQEYLVISRNISKIALNNNQESVRLFDFKKNTINEIEYEESKENASFSRIHISSTDEIWEWTNDITKGKKNPQYEIFTGNIQQFQKNPSNPEQNELLLQTSIEKIAIFVSDSIVETALAKTLFVPETKIKIIAQEKNQGNYELKSFEILKKAPPQKQKTSTAATLIKWTLLLLAGGICLKKIWFKNNLWEKIKASVISKK